MKTHRVTIDVSAPNSSPHGRFDADRVDTTEEANITRHIAEDEAEAAQDAARYTRKVRQGGCSPPGGPDTYSVFPKPRVA